MADWYVSSVVYAALPTWTATTTVSVGTIWAPTAPATNQKFAFRCTTAGTTGATQPSWPSLNNGTVTDGTAVWTNVTGQATYNWAAPAGTFGALFYGGGSVRTAAGDRVFASSDHAETGTSTSNQFVFSGATTTSPIQVFSVNRLSGNIPPLATDITAGASITFSAGSVTLDANMYFDGITFNFNGTATFAGSNNVDVYFANCLLKQTSTNSGSYFSTLSQAKVTLDNTPVYFGATGQSFIAASAYTLEINWIETPSALPGTIPTTLVTSNGSGSVLLTAKGVDFSAMGASNYFLNRNEVSINKILLANCKLGSGQGITTGTPPSSGAGSTLELVNCDSGATNYRCERHTRAGDVTTNTSTTLVGGASNGTTAFSRQIVSTAAANFLEPIAGFPIDVWNSLVGSSHTLTVQIISSATLTNAQVWLEVEYLGSSSNPESSIVSSAPATILTTATSIPTSSSTWNNPPATPVAQQLQVTFTPQQAGLVRATVKVAASSITVYYDPTATIV